MTNLDTERETESEFEFFNGPFIDVPFLRKVIDLYLPHKKDRLNPLASPMKLSKAEAAKLPSSTIIVDALDILRSDGLGFGELLQQAGVNTALVRGEGLIHDAYILEATRQDPTCLAIVGLITSTLKAALQPSTGVKSTAARPAKQTTQTNGNKRKRAKRE